MANPNYQRAGSAQSNSLSITINPGDFVCVMCVNKDNTAPSGLADNGGNLLGLYQFFTQSNAAGQALWAFYIAKNSATSISFTSGHTPSIAVVIFTNATHARYYNNGGGSSNNPLTLTGVSTVANSYGLAFYPFINTGGAVTVGATTGGTNQTSQASSTTVDGVLAVTSTALISAAGTTFSPSTSLSASVAWLGLIVFIENNTYQGEFPNESTIPAPAYIKLRYTDFPKITGGTTGGPSTPVPIGSVLKSGISGTAYSETISAQGGTGSGYTYSVTAGALPTGTSLNSSTGVISGTPSAAGSYSFTIKVVDSAGSFGSQVFLISISAPSYTLEEYGQVLHDAVVGTAYSETLSVTGGTGPYTWSLASGSLPTGLSLSSSGVISGTPSAAGTFTFAVTVTDSGSVTQTITFTIAAATPPASGGGSWVF